MRTSGWLLAGLSLLLVSTAPTQSTAVAQSGNGFLLTSGTNGEWNTTAYIPQPGDIILFDAFNRLHHALYKLANTGGPTHATIVVAGPDGSPALLDILGPTHAFAKVEVVDIKSRLANYNGGIMVRRVKQPLTPLQSQRLTEFAFAQDGKRFALGRVILLVTPFCPRTGLRHSLFARTEFDRNRWFCSELVVAACTVSGVLDGSRCPANATYPRDLAFDERFDFSPYYHPPLSWTSQGTISKSEK